MSAFENATKFFHACEGLKGWAGCRDYVAPGATFNAQCEPLAEITTVEAYTKWMAGVGSGPLKGCRYELHNAAWDENSRTALFFGTFVGRHDSDGGPVPPTHRETRSHYVYVLAMDGAGKVAKMTKIWNAGWSLRELGWG